AGASGLVTAKTAREAGHEVSIVEASSAIGGTFENKRYKDGRMVSSKYLTCFSDFRSPDAEMHMSLADYVAYLRDYAVHFGILDRIRFNVKVLEVAKTKKPGTEATYSVKL
ncbi:ptmN, partial [Symbiodinium microadriaticum]